MAVLCTLVIILSSSSCVQLCLMSGEIIQMSSSMNLIFETDDLSQASVGQSVAHISSTSTFTCISLPLSSLPPLPKPATVSRCGMIYLEPATFGWRPILTSWCVHYTVTIATLCYTDLQYYECLSCFLYTRFATLPSVLKDDHGKLVMGLIDWLVPPCLTFVHKQAKVCPICLSCHMLSC